MSTGTVTRFVSYHGKSTSSNASTFGMTIQDKASTTNPNMTQLTMIPTSGTLQTYKYLLTSSDTDGIGSTGTLSITPNLTLLTTRYYQFHATVTVVVGIGNGSYLTGHYTISSVFKGTSLIASDSFKVETELKESGIDAYVNDTSLSLTVSSGIQPQIILTMVGTASTVDMMADISINSAAFT